MLGEKNLEISTHFALLMIKIPYVICFFFFIYRYKDRVDRTIRKIYLMKRFITDLIGTAMCRELHDNDILIDMLATHKETVTLDTIRDLLQNQDSTNNSNS